MEKSNKYQSAASYVESLGSVVPKQLAEVTNKALSKLSEALNGDVSGYVANRLHMSMSELADALSAEQVDGVALAMYNIEKKGQSVIIGDQTGLGKGRQAAAMIRYGLLSGYLPVFFTERYTLFSDMYRDCKALGIKDARPLVVNAGASVVDFDNLIEDKGKETPDEIWSPASEDEDNTQFEEELMHLYQKQYEIVYKAPPKNILQGIIGNGDIPTDTYDYLMITYSQLKDAKRDATRLEFLQSLCTRHRVLFIFDEAHRSSSVNAGKPSAITQGINKILSETTQTQCLFLSATFAKRPESFITFMQRTELSALAAENTLEKALMSGGVPMQEYVSSSLASIGQMIRREQSTEGIPTPFYTYLDDDLPLHEVLFDKVMYFFREIVKLSDKVNALVVVAKMKKALKEFSCYPTRSQLFYINKVLLLSLKAQKVAQVAINEVRQGRCVVIGMSDTLECVLQDVIADKDGNVRGDISALLLRLLEKTVRNTKASSHGDICSTPVFNKIEVSGTEDAEDLLSMANEIEETYKLIAHSIEKEVFHLPMSPIDVIRQLITREQFVAQNGDVVNIRFEECTGRAHQLEYLSPDGDDDFTNAVVIPRKKRHSNHIFNDFQNNKLDVMLINACGAIGASAHAISTTEVSDNQVRQRKMLIVQNDLDVNIDLQKRGRINRTGQRADLPPLYEYIITAIPSEKRLNMMLRAKLRSLSANTTACQDQNKDQADFIDISNKYGNDVASDYILEKPELASILNLNGSITATKVLARIAMLSVATQQDIVDDIITAYTTLEAELRRINQWDLEREFRDFEAEFVHEELFTTAKANTKFGGCSYLTTYKCRQKTFPYTFEALTKLCETARQNFGDAYKSNTELQKKVNDYYSKCRIRVKEHTKERETILHDETKHTLVNICHDENLAEHWIQKACKPSGDWTPNYFKDVNQSKDAKHILRKLISFSNEHQNLLKRENAELNKYALEKKRLVKVLSSTEIGKGYSNIGPQLANDECTSRVIAVLRDIRFGNDDRKRFLPSRVEFVFALSAVNTEIRINLVHNNKWSNYDRLMNILNSSSWQPTASVWDAEIASNNNKIVERKIITGNILGAYVHPAIAELKPRFITFSLKNKDGDKPNVQSGLLLPMDESKLRDAIKSVSIPLNEGIKYAISANISYVIAGLNVNFSLLPYRESDSRMKFVICVFDKHSKNFETDKQFDEIRQYFVGTAITSINDNHDNDKKSHKPLMHYQTEQLQFESNEFKSIIQHLSQMDAVIIVPRDHLTYGDVKDFMSRSEREDNKPWAKLDWKGSDMIPMPPVNKKKMLHISSPILPKRQKGKPVFNHSEYYNMAKEAMELNGLPLSASSTLQAIRRNYIKWKKYYSHYTSWSNPIYNENDFREICRTLLSYSENKSNKTHIDYDNHIKMILQRILDSEHLSIYGKFFSKFDEEMLFMSPNKKEAQAFLDDMPCSPDLDSIRKCIQDYIDGKSDIINSPDNW